MATAKSSLACALRGKPCKWPHTLVEEKWIDGEWVVVKGSHPPPLCDSCPVHELPEGKQPNRGIVARHHLTAEHMAQKGVK
jgi:hypothetical protein